MKYSTNFQTFLNCVKMFLGNTFLTIPAVFKATGWLGGLILYVFIGILNTYSMAIIVDLVRDLSKKKLPNGEYKNVKSFSDLGFRL